MECTVKAYAKINISLDIVSKMDNGYHMLEMVMQSISLHDDVTIRTNESGRMSVQTNLKYLPKNDGNIALRAAKVFFNCSGIKNAGVDIEITKRIPVGAGMGGGSTDGAAVLRGLNDMYGTGMNKTEIQRLGEQVGSDVPFCVGGGTVLAKGRGEILSDLTPITECFAVVCKPPFSISTAELFSKVRCEKIKRRPDTRGIIDALANGILADSARRMYNVFEDVLPAGAAAAVQEIKYRLLDYGALGAVMTGSGSAVFGVFSDEGSARDAYNILRADYEECYLTETVGKYFV